jgi:energy-coupling factor transport system permease protein
MTGYRPVASPLHAARAGAGVAYCAAVAGAALLLDHPFVLAVLLAGVVGAAAGAGVLVPLRRAAGYAVVLAATVAVINPLTARYGLTVLWRFGDLGPLGRVDVTLEALTYGGVLGLRVLVVVLAAALFSLAIDPDALLRLFRRVSLRSALTAVLATRLVPVLTRDARRLDDARRCRPDGGGTGMAARTAVLRALSAGALDRAVDVAATLEVRGFGSRPPRRAARHHRPREPWSRHDAAFALAAAVVLALALGGRLGGIAAFSADPVLSAPVGPAELGLVAGLALALGLPFADRRGIAR